MDLKQAIEILRKELINDKDYFYSWQSNIAIPFQDVAHRMIEERVLHKLSNEAAKRFLNLLINK